MSQSRIPGLLLASGDAATAQDGRRPVGAACASRSPVHAEHGAAATTNPLATSTALEVLRRGGSALDAALAANAVLAVVEPFNTGPGGDLFALVWDPQARRLHGYNGSGRASAAGSLAALKSALGADARQVPGLGAHAVTVPGAVEAWYALHARFGRLPMPALLEPAIGYARDGFPVAQVAAHLWADNASRIDCAEPGFAGFGDTFLPAGRAPRAGERFRNAAMAESLHAIATGGLDAFYRGAIGSRIVATLQHGGSAMQATDLATHRGDWVEPLSVRYRGYDVHELPPNTQGGVVLQVLKLLEGHDLRALGPGSAGYAHLLVEALKLAWEDRADHYADAAHAPALARLLSDEHAAARRALLDPARARAARGCVPRESHTTYLAVADRDGMMVSLISSLFDGFGSGLVPEGLGFALQSRGVGFSLLEGHPNAWGPGKRPLHTIIPAFVTRDGAPWFAFGVLGGSFQPQGHVQVLVNLVDFGMDAQAAGDAPRIAISGGPDPWNPAGGTPHRVHLEPGIDDAVLEALRKRGHEVMRGGTFFGGYNGIRRDPATGIYEAATEMRLDGAAGGF